MEPASSLDWRAINAARCETLERHVRPQTFPLAIRMWPPDEPFPEKARRPLEFLGHPIATCQAFSIARRYGWTLAVGREDLNCPLTRIAFGFDPPVPVYKAGCLCEGMYTETREAGARTESMVARFDLHRYRAMVVAPWRRATFAPDVVLVFGTPGQVLRLVVAALWKSGGYLASRFSGRLDCSDQVIHTMQTGACQVILPCYGDRIFGHTEDHEMAFSIPREQIETVLEGLEGTHRGGIRYPIPSFLQFHPRFPPSYEALLQELDGAADAEEAGHQNGSAVRPENGRK